MSEYEAAYTSDGALVQSGVPKHAEIQSGFAAANGLMLRGVVTATYVLDDPDHPYVNGPPIAVYCDVLCYSGGANSRWRLLKYVLVSQDVGGIHREHIWKPRACTMDITGAPEVTFNGGNPANWDGDHVLVGFMDNNLNQPVILRGIPHPAADTGNDTKNLGHRVRLKLADGDPNFWKHHGSFFGVAQNGDWVVDTTFAYDGKLPTPDGKEPTANAMDGSGAQLHKLPQAASWKIQLMDAAGTTPSAEFTLTRTELKHVILDALGDLLLQIGGGATLKVEGKDALAKLTLGDGAVHVAIGEQLQTWWDIVKTALDIFGSHVHDQVLPGAPGQFSQPPLVPLVTPPWAPTNTSTKVAIPDL